MFLPQLGSPQQKPKRLRLVVDVSGSMYRFNGVDGRLERSMEAVCMVMEAFENYEEKFKVWHELRMMRGATDHYMPTGHSGLGHGGGKGDAGSTGVNKKLHLLISSLISTEEESLLFPLP